MRDDLGERRLVAMLVLAVLLLASIALRRPHARVEITTAQASVLLETRPLRIQASIRDVIALSIGAIAR